MDANILQRVMDLAEKTGDRVIVVNPQTGTAHAVVPFDDYERLVADPAILPTLKKMGDYSDPLTDDEISGEEFDRLVEEIDKEVAAEIKAEKAAKEPAINEEISEINRKIAEESQKIVENPAPLDVLDDEANEEEYYLEPLE